MKYMQVICFLIALICQNKTHCFSLQEDISFLAKGPINAVAWHKNQLLAIAACRNRISVFSQNEKNLFSLGLKGHIQKVNTVAWRQEPLIENTKKPDIILASGSDDTTIKLWSMNEEGCKQTLTGHSGSVTTLAWHPCTQNFLASGSSDSTVKLWDISQKEPMLAEYKAGGFISIITWSDDGKYLAVASQTISNNNATNIITILSLEDKKLNVYAMYKKHTKKINGFVFLNNTRLLSCGDDGVLFSYDIQKKQMVSGMQLGDKIPCIARIKIKDTNFILIGFKANIELWEEKKDFNIDYIKSIPAHKKNVSCLLIDQETLFSGSEDMYVKQWNIQ